MAGDDAKKITFQTAQMDAAQHTMVINHLFLALRQTFVKLYELNGAQAVIDMQEKLINGALNSDSTGFPLDKEKAVIDTTVTILRAVVTVEGKP